MILFIMTRHDYVGITALVLILFLFMIGNIEVDILKQENRFLNKQYNNCQQEITVLKHQLDSISRTPKQEIYIYP